jgi:hypothetical protein
MFALKIARPQAAVSPAPASAPAGAYPLGAGPISRRLTAGIKNINLGLKKIDL